MVSAAVMNNCNLCFHWLNTLYYDSATIEDKVWQDKKLVSNECFCKTFIDTGLNSKDMPCWC